MRGYEAALKNLSERERHVVRARFGINAEMQTLGQLACELSITRERVRQIERAALRRMGTHLSVKRLHDAAPHDPAARRLIARLGGEDITRTVTKKEMCDILSINDATMEKWIRQRKIPHFLLGARVMRFDPKAVLEHLCVEATSRPSPALIDKLIKRIILGL